MIPGPAWSFLQPEGLMHTATRQPDVDELRRRVDQRLVVVLDQMRRAWARVQKRYDDGTELVWFDLAEEARSAALAPSKRLRPTMILWGYRAVAPTAEAPAASPALVDLAVAAELLHLFALVHDDVMDQSTVRRGRPTLHVVAAGEHGRRRGRDDAGRFGDNVGMLLGDLLLSEASLLTSSLPADVRQGWRDMVVELVYGQLADLSGAASPEITANAARLIADIKSGAYTITRPLQLGALLAYAERDDPQEDRSETMRVLAAYGDHVGLAFALRDDILGIWGDPRHTGKPAGDDLLEGKPTMIRALAQQRLSEAEFAAFDALVAGPESHAVAEGVDASPAAGRHAQVESVAQVMRALERAGVLDEAERLVSEAVAEATAVLDRWDGDPEVRVALAQLATAIAWRAA